MNEKEEEIKKLSERDELNEKKIEVVKNKLTEENINTNALNTKLIDEISLYKNKLNDKEKTIKNLSEKNELSQKNLETLKDKLNQEIKNINTLNNELTGEINLYKSKLIEHEKFNKELSEVVDIN